MALSVGTRLGPYEILAPLGAGGMGEVYRARDTRLERDVAIKVLPAEVAQDAGRLARFEREAKLLASLNHPNVAHVYGFEAATLPDGSVAHFLAMELVEGEDLAVRLKRGAIPIDETLAVAKQIAEGLEEAHEKGIVHRDLKPANVKLTPDGKVKVLDFGLAKDYAADSAGGSSADLSQSPTLARTGTQAGVILGTAAYMSPEQAKGKPVDRRADTWAFGCVLYEMLTGTRAFGGETVTDVLAAVVRDEPDWRRLPTGTPSAARNLLQRCLRKEVRQRFQAIGDARIGIEDVLAGPATPDDVAASPTPPSWRRALPWVAGLAAGALVTAATLGGLALRRSHSPAMHFRAVTNFGGVQAQPALSPDGRSLAFVSNRDGDYNIYVGLVSGEGNLVQVTDGNHAKARPCWSPDGTTIAYARLNDWGRWDIWQVPALGGTPRRLIPNAADPAWSRDGELLAYANLATGTIWVSDSEGQNARQLTPVGPTGYGPAGLPTGYGFHDAEPRFSPNGRELAYVIRTAGPYGELMLLDLDSGQVRQLTHDSALALSPAWSPDGLHVYFASSRGGALNVWKTATRGGDLEQITAGQGDDAQPDVSFDGSRLVFATYREHIGIAQMDLDAGPGTQSTRLTSDPARNAFAPVYSPDGARIAYFSNYKGVENEAVWVADADGSGPVPLVQDARRVSVFPRWTPDSEFLIYRSEPPTQVTDGDYRRVSLSGGTPEPIVERALDLFFDVGPDGRLLFKDAERRVASYDPATDETEVLATSPLSQEGGILRWSPNGRSVAYVVRASQENDPNAGLWVEDLEKPPRQIFPGWVTWYARGPNGLIWLQEGKPDLNGVLWKVGWGGQGLTRHSTIRRAYSYWNPTAGDAQSFFDVSPDGRHLAFDTQEVLQANIGMIDNVR